MKENPKDSLGDRMKTYESVSGIHLSRRIPVIIRVDGRAFHTFCKRFQKPFDVKLNDYLNSVMLYLCSNIQGAKYAERHSDEISILVTDYDDINTEAFFDYGVQKICSIVASMATAEFCRQLMIDNQIVRAQDGVDFERGSLKKDEKWPTFDARCFNIPESDVVNYFYWRLNDCLRNSISMLAQSKFSHKQLNGKSNSEKQEMLFKEFGINWNNIPQCQKSGFACVIRKVKINSNGQEVERNKWQIIDGPCNRVEIEKEINQALVKVD